MESLKPNNVPDYVNDPRRPTVVRGRQADTLAEQIRASSKLEPISIDDYNRKVRHLRTVARVGYGNHDDDDGTGKTRETPQNRHLQTSESSFLNRVITFLGEDKASLEADPTNVAFNVEQFIQKVMEVVVCDDPRFDGKLVACGSYYEGVKVKAPNEFDYIWELKPSSLHADDLTFVHVKPETFKPRKHPDVYGRSYYKLEFKDRVPNVWRCQECRKLKVAECTHRTLSSRQLQERFRDTVHKVASRLGPEGKEAQVTSSGPAVTLFTQINKQRAAEMLTSYGKKKLSRHTDIDCYLIKIDLTLAIPVEKKESYLKWPLEGFGDVELDPELADCGLDINRCHLVTAGDFWRVSFSSWETELVHQLTADNSNKKSCFQALKYMRDILALTGDHETSLLGTYPLKVSFLKENRGRQDDRDWTFPELSGKTRRILEHVETGGSDGKLTSYFIKNDPVLLESDRSYLESRRIRQYLEKIAHQYRVNGYVHLVILSVFLFCHVIICLVSGLYLRQYIGPDPMEECPKEFNNDPFIFEVGKFFFTIIPLTIVCFVLSMVGFLWVVIQTWCIWTANVLYDMFKGPFYIYLAFVTCSVIQLAVAIRLGAGFSEFFPKCQNTSRTVPQLSAVIVFFSALILLFTLVHSCMFLLRSRRKLKFYSWEIIFFDYMYREAFESCHCMARHTEPPPPQILPPGLTNSSFQQPGEDYEDVTPRVPIAKYTLQPDVVVPKRKPPRVQVDHNAMARPYEEASIVATPVSPASPTGTDPVPGPRPVPKPKPNPRTPDPRPEHSPPPPLPPRQHSGDTSPGESFDNVIYSIT